MKYKAIKILNCSDPYFWYKDFVGCYVPYLSQYEQEYVTKEPAGFTNIVLKLDSVLLEMTDDEWHEMKITYYGN